MRQRSSDNIADTRGAVKPLYYSPIINKYVKMTTYKYHANFQK